MATQEVRRGTASARILVAVAADHGVPAAACLAGTGITPAMLDDPLAEIDTQQDLRVVENVVRHTEHVPGIGLEAGARYTLTAYGIWGYAMLSSRTLRSAFELGGRYIGLTFTFFRAYAKSEPDALRVVFEDPGIPPECFRFLLERDVAASVAIAGAMILRRAKVRVATFGFPRPPYAARFAEFIDGPVEFDASRNEIVFDTELADRLLPQANEATARLCEEQCQNLLEQRRFQAPVSERVRRHLLRPGAVLTVEVVAAALGMAPRTLQRSLEVEGTTFRELVAEVRRVLAEEMLAQRMTVDEIAERLGYAEAASFVHAFKRWTGVPPGRFRRHPSR
jgi:AraC-like DNA-binding protein